MKFLTPFVGVIVLAAVSNCVDFNQKLIGEIGKSPKENWVIAPASISCGLGMLYLGARTHTAEEISKQLSLSSDSQEAHKQLKDRQHALQDDLSKKDGAVSWLVANKILVNEDVPLKESIKTDIKDLFAAQIENADFSNSVKIAEDVNKWVKESTEGFIDKLLKEGDCPADTKMLLLNAVYFKGAWKTEFAEAATEKDCFYVKGEECTEVDMMKSKNSFASGSSDALKANLIRIPYANSNFSMVIILPKEGTSLEDSTSGLLTSDIKNEVESLGRKQLSLSLPKFAFEYGKDMSTILTQIGMGKMFSSSADLSGFSDVDIPLKVGKIVHKARITVNEAGTEAAGATGILIYPRMGHSESYEFEVNRPFTFLIYHSSGDVLFGGQVLDPTK